MDTASVKTLTACEDGCGTKTSKYMFGDGNVLEESELNLQRETEIRISTRLPGPEVTLQVQDKRVWMRFPPIGFIVGISGCVQHQPVGVTK